MCSFLKFLDTNECECERGWSALSCDNKFTCNNNQTCFTNGKCSKIGTKHICVCAYGYGGSMCSQKLLSLSNFLLSTNKFSSIQNTENSTTTMTLLNSKLFILNNNSTHLSLAYIEIMVKLF